MVFRTCQAVLRDRHDAEDAFQATFLVLARISTIRRGTSLVGCFVPPAKRRGRYWDGHSPLTT